MAIEQNEQLQLPGNEEPSEQISLIPEEQMSTKISPEAMEQKIMKAHFALGESSPSPEYLRADFESTLGDETRRQAVINEKLAIEGGK